MQQQSRLEPSSLFFSIRRYELRQSETKFEIEIIYKGLNLDITESRPAKHATSFMFCFPFQIITILVTQKNFWATQLEYRFLFDKIFFYYF